MQTEELKQPESSSPSKVPRKVWNRRYKKLQELIDQQEYFSEEMIRIRDPLMYFLYVGQYKRNKGKSLNDTAFHEFLIEQIQRNEYEVKLQEMHDALPRKHDFPSLDSEKDITDENLEDNIDELIRLMHDKFMVGLDYESFDYQSVDNNSDYDDHKTMDQEEMEKYFDQEDEEIHGDQSIYTGELDY